MCFVRELSAHLQEFVSEDSGKTYFFFTYGVGAAVALRNLAPLFSSFPAASFHAILIVGTCGALEPSLEIADVFEIGEVGFADACLNNLEASLYKEENIFTSVMPANNHVLLTSMKFCTEEDKRYLYEFGAVVDMETYFVLDALRKCNLSSSYRVVRSVSDTRYSNNSFADFKENLSKASEALAIHVRTMLEGQ